MPHGMLSQENCLNSPSGYSLAFIISDGFKITANIFFSLLGAEGLISHSH